MTLPPADALGPPAPRTHGTAVEHTVWQQDDVDPGAVEQAMIALERERSQRRRGVLPARALNLVVVVDADYTGEIVRRLDAVGRNAPSRTVLVRVHGHRRGLSARVTLSTIHEGTPDEASSELVTLDVAQRHLTRLDSIVDPIVLTDVPTLLWAPHGHVDALESLGTLGQTVLLDTADAADYTAGLDAAQGLIDDHGLSIVDLSWLRATPWRLRLASHYEPPARRGELWSIADVQIRHQPGSETAAWLFLGWLADRLGWTPEHGRTRDASGAEVGLRLSPVDVGVQGLAGATVTSRAGAVFSLDRNRGGLRAGRTDVYAAVGEHTSTERHWTVLGASRGEAGVLGRALRRTLVPDDGYIGALATARRLLSCT
ncbi:glucose-6-phosphate dehydrogenase assembly protein OpcA [Patulibacter sp.]|uniref:glucose-6-phosphate dehydrogenase assembly protein OpcA n=1 Tax=Patulibacter sp. TaxID=1912859 RepID=UPI002715E3D7|nr:glucose-6-phosphate dehydrogenase assembly protein OpcA [Patulibacter sp.]MDO9408093.1 glucose-6-phosphate dehydrogenase assembly protein OpcA [Patulibacter sp.]